MDKIAYEIFTLGWFKDYYYKPIRMSDEKFESIRNENDEKIMARFKITKEEATKLQDEACSIADIAFT